ncbi:adenylyltransferase/cytidyltransferase family protein [Candidatus Nomurabacteria bacterium]|nr:adenylyltransferase/cytidyltransferase family protein [Candidatus Nomurabacteria bacterium]
MGCVIVLIMGTWDLKHLGHENYIELGKDKAGEKFPKAEHVITVVAVDSDELTRARKGPKRPFVPEMERARQIAHTRSTDIVTIERKLAELPKILPHDVRVISESTNDEKKLKAQGIYCGQIVNLQQQLNDNSSARLSRLTLEGMAQAADMVESAMLKVLKEIKNGRV